MTAPDRGVTYQIALASTGSSTHDACSCAGGGLRVRLGGPANLDGVKQRAYGLAVMDAAHSFGECRRDR
jgi:hypothetical protein